MEEKRINMIRLSKSSLNEKEKQSVMGVLDREYLGMGVEVQQFEKIYLFFLTGQLCALLTGLPHCIWLYKLVVLGRVMRYSFSP